MNRASSCSEESHCCHQPPPNPSLCQGLDELDFQRGIWQAAIDGETDRIEDLVKTRHVLPNSNDSYGYTALHYAARAGHLATARTLIRLGANVNCQTKNNQSTPLHRAILSPSSNAAAMVQLLLDANAQTSLPDVDGLTPLEKARNEGKGEIVKILEQYRS